MTFLGSFVARYFKAIEPSMTQSPDGDWIVRIPVPIYAEVKITQREAVSGRLSPNGFLRELAERGRVEVERVIAEQKASGES